MKRNECFSFFGVVTPGALVGLLLVACSTNPPPLGQTVTPQQGGNSTSPQQGGTSATSGQGQGGAPAITTFALPAGATLQPVDAMEPDAASLPASGDANCGSTQSKLQKKPVDLLLVLDRSTSMTYGMDTNNTCSSRSTTCSQRAATIIASLGKVLASSPAEVNWGLKFFSSPTSGRTGMPGTTNSNCYVASGADLPLAAGTASKIPAQVTAAGNAGYTPTRLAINNSVAYLKTVDDGNPKFILLATDGEPNCSPDESDQATVDLDGTKTAVMTAVAAGYKVFVLGVGPAVGNLTDLAQAGGTDKFYSATTPEALSAALSSIVGTVAAGCTYELPSTPIAPNAVGVFADKSLIPQNDSDGWSYAPGSKTTININGSYCEDLKAGKKTLVEIFLPCKATDPIPLKII